MMNYLITTLVFVIFSFAISSAAASDPNDFDDRHAPVFALKEMQEHEVFCLAEDWTRGKNDKYPSGAASLLEPKFRQIFSKDFFSLFMWSQCAIPNQIEPLTREKSFYFDFRYGTQAMGGSEYVKHIRLEPPRLVANGRVMVRVLWDNGDIKNAWTSYTLIRENGQWKIDDIALKGYSTEMEEILPGSKSLKTELQAAYKRAEAKYQRDQQTLKKK